MVYIDAVKGSGIALIVFIIATVLAPVQTQIKGIEIVLTVSTFLFAIIAGLYLSRMNSRYDQIREAVYSEDALWLSLYNTAKVYGGKFLNNIRELIDKYYIVAYDFAENNDYYKHSAKYFIGGYDELKKQSKYRGEGAFQTMLELLADIEQARNKTSVLILEKLKFGQWIVMILLGGIVIFSVFYLKSADMFSQITTIVLSTVMVLVILLLRDLQNQRIAGSWMMVESGEEVLDFIGKLRYYPEVYVKHGSMKIPDTVKVYRSGLHKPGEKFKIKVVNNQ